MQQLIMNKKIIRGVIDFTENFSAKDVLYSKEIAAGFFFNKLRNISLITQYHSEIFRIVCLEETPYILSRFKKPSDYMTKTKFAHSIKWDSDDKKQLEELMSEEKFKKLAERTWKIAQGTNLEDATEKAKLFCLLTAAYALARRSPDEEGFKIDSDQAERAYLGEPEPDKNDVKELELTGGSTVVRIPAREQPYEIHLKRSEAAKRLKEGSRITHIKLVADEHIIGYDDVCLTLEIFDENSSEPKQTVTLAGGEYIFINIVDEYPVLVHSVPKSVQTGNVLCYSEQHSESCLIIELTESGGIINHTKYCNRSEGLGGRKAVELTYDNGRCIYLSDDGKIHGKGIISDESKRYAAIEDYIKER